MAIVGATRRLPSALRIRSKSVILGLIVGVIAFLLMSRIVLERAPAADLLLITQDLPAGTILTSAHLGSAAVILDDQTAAGYLGREELPQVLGRPLHDRAYKNMLLRREQLGGATTLTGDLLAVSLPVKPENALAGNLKAGDLVMVVQARADRTEILLERASILDINAKSGLIVTLALNQPQMQQVLTARTRGDLQLVLLPPGAAVAAATGGATLATSGATSATGGATSATGGATSATGGMATPTAASSSNVGSRP